VAEQSRGRVHRTSWRVLALYVMAVLREFRLTLLTLALAVTLGTFLYAITPHKALDGNRPTFLQALYGGWMALLAQPLFNPPETWYLTVLCAIYPLVGAVVIGEGVIRLAMLMMSRRRGEKEWTRVMVSTYRNHVIVCGLGHLGFRVVKQLLGTNIQVVALERRKSSRFIPAAKELGVPVLIRDMKDDAALIDAGIEHARAIVIATNDALANLEVAMNARRMNGKIRVVMRMFDEQIAAKVSDAMDIDVAFSSSQLAAPVVAALAVRENVPGRKVLASSIIGGQTYVTVEMTAEEGDGYVGNTLETIDSGGTRVLGHGRAGDAIKTKTNHGTVVGAGDVLVLHVPVQTSALL
jgi:Trk K+ transport system NAD-binding subunit